MSKAPRLINFEGFEINQVLHVKLVSKRLSQQTMSDVRSTCIHVHLLCDRSWLCVKTPWPWKFFKCGLFRDKNNDLLNVLGRLLFHKLSINVRCCRTGDDSNFSLHRVQRVLRQSVLENQDLEMVSKPLDGINGPENNNNKRRQSKQNQEKT